MALTFNSRRIHSCSWRSAFITRVGELCEDCTPVTTFPHVSHFHGSTGASTVVPGQSRETILNTTGTCSTVHYMPCSRQCSATESWRALALTLHQIFVSRSATCLAGSFACLLFRTLGAFHAQTAPVWGQSTLCVGCGGGGGPFFPRKTVEVPSA